MSLRVEGENEFYEWNETTLGDDKAAWLDLLHSLKKKKKEIRATCNYGNGTF